MGEIKSTECPEYTFRIWETNNLLSFCLFIFTSSSYLDFNYGKLLQKVKKSFILQKNTYFICNFMWYSIKIIYIINIKIIFSYSFAHFSFSVFSIYLSNNLSLSWFHLLSFILSFLMVSISNIFSLSFNFFHPNALYLSVCNWAY